MRSIDDLTLHVYGLLDETAEREMASHAKACPDCRAMIGRIAAEHRFLQGALRLKSTSPADAETQKHRD